MATSVEYNLGPNTYPRGWFIVAESKELDEGPMVTAQLTDVDNSAVEIGMPVEMVTRKMRNDGDERGLIVYGYKFRPAWNMPQG